MQQYPRRCEKLQHYIAWRAVWKKSVSTPCRIVFDASQPTASGFSDILAKGRNNLNKLQEIVIRWFIHKFAFATDIHKMYNTIHLDEDEWCYQRYLWQTDLNPLSINQTKLSRSSMVFVLVGIRQNKDYVKLPNFQGISIQTHVKRSRTTLTWMIA